MAVRVIHLMGPLDNAKANQILAQLLCLEQEDATAPIRFLINSSGGLAPATLAIYDGMQLLRCEISTTAMRQVGGAAALLVAAGTPGKRACLPYAQFALKLYEEKHQRVLADLYARHCGQPLELNREYTAQEALRCGLVDEIVS